MLLPTKISRLARLEQLERTESMSKKHHLRFVDELRKMASTSREPGPHYFSFNLFAMPPAPTTEVSWRHATLCCCHGCCILAGRHWLLCSVYHRVGNAACLHGNACNQHPHTCTACRVPSTAFNDISYPELHRVSKPHAVPGFR